MAAAPTLQRARSRASLMGTTAEVIVLAAGDGARDDRDPQRLADRGIDALRELERRWSRFLPDSDVSRINDGAGRLVAVDVRTAALVRLAVRASDATASMFSPLVGAAMCDNGYVLPWERGWSSSPRTSGERTYRSADPRGVIVELDGGISDLADVADAAAAAASARVAIPVGTRLDLGGIAKGRAADLVATMLLRSGAQGVTVNVGGDLRVIGGPTDVTVDDPGAPDDAARGLATWTVRDGGVATSSTLRRRWSDGQRTLHHLVDPLTGAPTQGPCYVSVVAGTAADAEVLTKVGMVGGVEALRGWTFGRVRAVVVDADGTRRELRDGSARLLGARIPLQSAERR